MLTRSVTTARRAGFVASVALLSLASLSGCSSDDDDGSGSGDAGQDGGSRAPGEDSGTTSGDATVSDSGEATDAASTSADATIDAGLDAGASTDAGGGVDAAADGGAAIARTGSVVISEMGDAGFATFAVFTEIDGAGNVPGTSLCESTTISASCTFESCTTVPATADGGTISRTSNAGTLDIDGFDAGTVAIPWDTMTKSYPTVSGAPPGGQLVAGSSLTFSAPGAAGSVGPFRAVVVAPADIIVTAPTFTGGTRAEFPGASDLTITWTGGQAGTQVAVLLETQVNPMGAQTFPVKTITCTFDAVAGVGVVPSRGGLADMNGAEGEHGLSLFNILPQSSAVTPAGNAGGAASASDAWSVTTTAVANGVRGTFITTN